MNKKIEFDYQNKHYVLEYNRKAIVFMESQGFSVNDMTKKPMTMLPLAFTGLFYKNHRNELPSVIDEIYEKCVDKEKLLTTISEMLLEVYDTLQQNPEEGSQGNIEWKIV